jgi:hypothetical protein
MALKFKITLQPGNNLIGLPFIDQYPNTLKNTAVFCDYVQQQLGDGANVVFILGQGVGLFNTADGWSGNLNSLQPSSGYWINVGLAVGADDFGPTEIEFPEIANKRTSDLNDHWEPDTGNWPVDGGNNLITFGLNTEHFDEIFTEDMEGDDNCLDMVCKDNNSDDIIDNNNDCEDDEAAINSPCATNGSCVYEFDCMYVWQHDGYHELRHETVQWDDADAETVCNGTKSSNTQKVLELYDLCVSSGDDCTNVNFILGQGQGLFNTTDGWSGNLNTIENSKGYWININSSDVTPEEYSYCPLPEPGCIDDGYCVAPTLNGEYEGLDHVCTYDESCPCTNEEIYGEYTAASDSGNAFGQNSICTDAKAGLLDFDGDSHNGCTPYITPANTYGYSACNYNTFAIHYNGTCVDNYVRVSELGVDLCCDYQEVECCEDSNQNKLCDDVDPTTLLACFSCPEEMDNGKYWTEYYPIDSEQYIEEYYDTLGCMDNGNCSLATCGYVSPYPGVSAVNYFAGATLDDDSCVYIDISATDPGSDFAQINTADGDTITITKPDITAIGGFDFGGTLSQWGDAYGDGNNTRIYFFSDWEGIPEGDDVWLMNNATAYDTFYQIEADTQLQNNDWLPESDDITNINYALGTHHAYFVISDLTYGTIYTHHIEIEVVRKPGCTDDGNQDQDWWEGASSDPSEHEFNYNDIYLTRLSNGIINLTSNILFGNYTDNPACNFDGTYAEGWQEDGSCVHPAGETTCYLDDDGDGNAYESRTLVLGCTDTLETAMCVTHSNNELPSLVEPTGNYYFINCENNRQPHISCTAPGDVVYITTFHDIRYEANYGCTDGSIEGVAITEAGDITIQGINSDVYGYCRDGTAANNDNECYDVSGAENGYFKCNYDPFADLDPDQAPDFDDQGGCDESSSEYFGRCCVSDVGCGCGDFGGIAPACPDNYDPNFGGTSFDDFPAQVIYGNGSITNFTIFKDIETIPECRELPDPNLVQADPAINQAYSDCYNILFNDAIFQDVEGNPIDINPLAGSIIHIYDGLSFATPQNELAIAFTGPTSVGAPGWLPMSGVALVPSTAKSLLMTSGLWYDMYIKF